MKIPFAAATIALALAGCAAKKISNAATPAPAAAHVAETAPAASAPATGEAMPVTLAADAPGGAEGGFRPGCTPIGGEPPTCQ